MSGKQPDGGYDVRIWTPNVGEVPFAGHPVLGTSYVINKVFENSTADEVTLNLKVGQIPVSFCGGYASMKQNPPEFGLTIQPCEIAEIFGIDESSVREDYPVCWVSTGLEAVIIPLKDRTSLSEISMNKEKFMQYVKRHPECYCNHLFFVDMGDYTLSARCMMEDFIEDPATGSANGNLAGYMLKYDYFASDDISYTVYQGEDMGRRSVLNIHAAYSDGEWLIEVGGNCHIVASGEWS